MHEIDAASLSLEGTRFNPTVVQQQYSDKKAMSKAGTFKSSQRSNKKRSQKNKERANSGKVVQNN